MSEYLAGLESNAELRQIAIEAHQAGQRLP